MKLPTFNRVFLKLTHTHTHTLTLSHSHTLTHSHTHTLTHSHTHTLTHSHTHTLTHSHTHTLTLNERRFILSFPLMSLPFLNSWRESSHMLSLFSTHRKTHSQLSSEFLHLIKIKFLAL